MTIKMFDWIDLETVSTCNRFCPTCIRNSHPDKKEISSWFKKKYLSMNVIIKVLKQANKMGFAGGIRLSHYNEPLMDERICDIARMVKRYGYKAYINTNGDFITEELAKELDDVFEEMIITLYMDEPIKSKRAEWLRGLFHKAKVEICIESEHIPTHFSPKFDVKALAEKHKDNPCSEPRIRVIINHRRQYLLCCDDVVGNFDLGHFPETGIKDFWYGDKHVRLVKAMYERGGRGIHPYCLSCPRA